MSTISYALVRQRISAERFAPYEAEVDGNFEQAFALYEWNMRVSAAMFHAIGMLEVVLRNALHDQLSRARGRAWYHSAPLDFAAQRDVQQAVQRATRSGTPAEVPGKVIAELSFGFWRFLLSRKYHTSLWVPVLYRAFPVHRDAARWRVDVESRVERLYFLRNRVAHHEPVHRRDLRRDFDDLLTVTGWICADTQAWVKACSNVPAVLTARPK